MSCYIYWDKIKRIASRLEGLNYHFDEMDTSEVMPLLDEIEEIAHDSTIDFESAKHILDDAEMNHALSLIRKFYVNLGMKLEMEKAQEVIESDSPWETLRSFYFYPRYLELLKNEAALGRFRRGERAVFIGGGPLPLTGILLSHVYGMRVNVVEIEPDIAELSRKVIEGLGVDGVNVITGDETVIDGLEFDVLMVAALAEPKRRVFRNIRRYVDTETRIIYRTYTGMRAILYAPVSDEDITGFRRAGVVLPSGKVNNTSVLVFKCPD